MNKKTLFIFTSLLLFFFGNLYATNYYVATNGINTNNGTSLATPFLTIQKASDVAVSGDIVYVRAGVYREQVGIVSNGVTYQPYNGETVTINGTDLMLSWTLTTGTTYQTIMNWDMSGWGSNQLFADGKMIELARWPNQTSADIVMPTNAVAGSVTASGNNFIINDAAFNEPSGRWTGAKIWVNLAHNGYDGQGWTGVVVSTSSSKHTITVNFREAPRLGDQPWGLGATTEYFLFDPTATGVNATGGVNALLSNGEWWKSGTTLYVKTPNGAAPNATGSGTNIIEAKRRHFAFIPSVTNKSNYTIKGFNLFGCSITTDINAQTNRTIAEDAQNITIDAINAKYPSHQTDMTGNWQDQHYAWSGIVVSGRNNTIKNCTIQYAATSALSIQGFGTKVLNNTFRDANYMCSNSGALNTGFICQDAEIANNTIFNTTMMAINFKYSQNSNITVRDVYRIHHNTIFNFMRRSGDSGAIDAALSDGQWIRIDHNTIYTTTPVVGTMVHGIYLDYGGNPPLNDEGHFTIDHNVIYNIPAPLLINNLKDVNIFNNVLLGNGIPHPIEGAAVGTNFKIYNNIFSKDLSIRPDNLINADIQKNIYFVSGPNQSYYFVNPTADASGDYHLISTATTAVNAGISTGAYDGSLTGLPDIGAFETSYTTAATSPPTISNVTSSAASSWGEPALNAADGNSSTKWSQPTQSGWWRIQYSLGQVMNTYSIISTNDDNGLRDLKTWTIQGSNNGTSWTTLDTRTNQTWSVPNATNYYTFTNTTAYSYYQLLFTANNGSGYTQVAEIMFFGSSNNVSVTGVVVNPTTASVAAGTTTTLTATVAPSNATNQTVSWNSSNSAIATVNASGVVTGVAPGSANITATTLDGNKTATCAVTVTAASGSINIATGGTAYRWSKNSIATSNSNIVAAAGLNDGSVATDVYLNGGASPVDDDANAYEAAGVVWTNAQTGLNKVEFVNGTYAGGNSNGSFDANFNLQFSTDGTTWTNATGWILSPAYQYDNTAVSNATFTFTGSISNIKGVRVIGQVHTSASMYSWEGWAKEVRVYNSSNVLQRTANTTPPISNINSSIIVYPNPITNGRFNIGLDASTFNKKLTVVLTDITGKRVLTNGFISNGVNQRIDVTKLTPGVYIMNLINEKSASVKKIVIGSSVR